jgi:uncharacterized protein (DUF2132 family)
LLNVKYSTFEIKSSMPNSIKFSREKEAARSHQKWQEISKNRKLPRTGSQKETRNTLNRKEKTNMVTDGRGN